MTSEPTEQDRQLQLEQLFHHSYSVLLDLASEDRRLLVNDADNIVQALAARLAEYEGDLEDEAFLTWAGSVIRPAVTRISKFYQWMQEYRDSVRSGIWSILGKSLDLDRTNPSIISERIEFDTWFWVLQHMDDLMTPGSAKLSTRLYAQGKLHALTWRKSRLRALERFDDSDVEHYGTSETTEVDECGDITSHYSYFYDPGGHEDEEDEPQRPQVVNLPIPSPSNTQIAMRSGVPRLFCPVCQSLQDISPEVASTDGTIRLICLHARPALLLQKAAALKG